MRTHSLLYPIAILSIAIIINSCAQPLSPTGGDKDAAAPIVDSTRSNFQNGATNFNGAKIVIPFNEWITIRDLSKNLLISPPINPAPDIKIVGKKLVIDFDDVPLEENTTYSIYLGEAIQDITEGNPVPNFNLVFSTGPIIDTLELSGQINYATNLAKAPNVSVCLYKNSTIDSIVSRNPQYLTKSDENGFFKFNYIKEGRYKMLAFEDKNFNFKYDSINEPVAFLSDVINLDKNTSKGIDLRLFEPDKPQKIISKESFPGKYILNLTQAPQTIEVLNPDRHNIFYRLLKNSIILLYNCESSHKEDILIRIDSSIIDTLSHTSCESKDIERTINFSKNTVNSVLGDTVKFDFSIPAQSIEANLTSFWYQDSVKVQQTNYSIIHQLDRIKIKGKFSTGNYKFIMAPNSIIDFYGRSNSDSLICNIVVSTKESYGNLIFNADSVKNYKSIGVSIYKEQEKEIIYNLNLRPEMLAKTFKNVAVGSYRIVYYNDGNNNGRWDSGNFFKNLQPEEILKVDTREIRANWDLEMSPKF